MLDRLWRPARTRRYGNSGLVLVAILAILFLIPFYECPCGGRAKTVPAAPPTEDRFEFKMVWCGRCKGSGRIDLYEHWRVLLER